MSKILKLVLNYMSTEETYSAWHTPRYMSQMNRRNVSKSHTFKPGHQRPQDIAPPDSLPTHEDPPPLVYPRRVVTNASGSSGYQSMPKSSQASDQISSMSESGT